MPDRRFPELPDANPLTGDEVVALTSTPSSNPTSKQTTTQDIADLAGTEGDGGGTASDADIDARIASWARLNNPTGTVPDGRVSASIARVSQIPAAILPANAISPASSQSLGAVGTSTRYARQDHRHPAQQLIPNDFPGHTPIEGDRGRFVIVSRTNEDRFDLFGDAADLERIPEAPPAGAAGQNKVWKTDGNRIAGWRDDATGGAGGTAPTLANVVTALGLAAVASTNRQMGVRRKNDDTGFEYYTITAGGPPTLATVVTALGLAAVANANQGMWVRRKSDNTGFEYVAAPAGGGAAITVEDEGTALATAATTLNFAGSGVTASGAGAEKTITIPGGGTGGTVATVTPETIHLNNVTIADDANEDVIGVDMTNTTVGTLITAVAANTVTLKAGSYQLTLQYEPASPVDWRFYPQVALYAGTTEIAVGDGDYWRAQSTDAGWDPRPTTQRLNFYLASDTIVQFRARQQEYTSAGNVVGRTGTLGDITVLVQPVGGIKGDPGTGGGAQRSRQDTIELLIGDDAGSIDFTRDGSGDSSDLRGTVRANTVTSQMLSALVRGDLARIPAPNPGNNVFWGTDGSGTVGWRAAGSSGATITRVNPSSGALASTANSRAALTVWLSSFESVARADVGRIASPTEGDSAYYRVYLNANSDNLVWFIYADSVWWEISREQIGRAMTSGVVNAEQAAAVAALWNDVPQWSPTVQYPRFGLVEYYTDLWIKNLLTTDEDRTEPSRADWANNPSTAVWKPLTSDAASEIIATTAPPGEGDRSVQAWINYLDQDRSHQVTPLFDGDFTLPTNQRLLAVTLASPNLLADFDAIHIAYPLREDPLLSGTFLKSDFERLVPQTVTGTSTWYSDTNQSALFLVDQGGAGLAISRTQNGNELAFAHSLNTAPAAARLQIFGINYGGAQGPRGEPGADAPQVWAIGADYVADQTVVFDDDLHICNTGHTSAADNDPYRSTNWTPANEIRSWILGEWIKVNTIVRVGDHLFRCTQTHQASAGHVPQFDGDLSHFRPLNQSASWANVSGKPSTTEPWPTPPATFPYGNLTGVPTAAAAAEFATQGNIDSDNPTVIPDALLNLGLAWTWTTNPQDPADAAGLAVTLRTRGGTSSALRGATTTRAGLLTAPDKVILNALAAGRRFNWRGEWDVATTYQRDDIVHYNDSALGYPADGLFIANQETTGVHPNYPLQTDTHWDTLIYALNYTPTSMATGLAALTGNARLSYSALKDTPTIPTVPSTSNPWPTAPTIGWGDLTGRPTIPAAPDWDAASGGAGFIANKPSIPVPTTPVGLWVLGNAYGPRDIVYDYNSETGITVQAEARTVHVATLTNRPAGLDADSTEWHVIEIIRQSRHARSTTALDARITEVAAVPAIRDLGRATWPSAQGTDGTWTFPRASSPGNPIEHFVLPEGITEIAMIGIHTVAHHGPLMWHLADDLTPLGSNPEGYSGGANAPLTLPAWTDTTTPTDIDSVSYGAENFGINSQRQLAWRKRARGSALTVQVYVR